MKRKGRLLAFLFLPVIIALVAFLRSDTFDIAQVTVSGNKTIPAADIIARAGIAPGTNVFMLDEALVLQRLSADARIEVQDVERRFPNRVILHIIERQPVIQVAYTGGWLVLDKNCIVISFSVAPLPKVPQLLGAEPDGYKVGQAIKTNAAGTNAIKGVMAALDKAKYKNRFLSADISDLNYIVMKFTSDYTVLFGSSYDMAQKMEMSDKIIANNDTKGISSGIIDVRIVKYGYFSQETPKPSEAPTG